MTDQSGHKVIGSAAAISSSTPSSLTTGNLNGATLAVELTGTTWGSSVAASNFSVAATPAIAGLSVSGVSGATIRAVGDLGDDTRFLLPVRAPDAWFESYSRELLRVHDRLRRRGKAPPAWQRDWYLWSYAK